VSVQVAPQAQELLGTSDLVIITEWVDDVALRIGQMVTMGLPEVLARPIPRPRALGGRGGGPRPRGSPAPQRRGRPPLSRAPGARPGHARRPSQPAGAGRWARPGAGRARCAWPRGARVARTAACGGGGAPGGREAGRRPAAGGAERAGPRGPAPRPGGPRRARGRGAAATPAAAPGDRPRAGAPRPAARPAPAASARAHAAAPQRGSPALGLPLGLGHHRVDGRAGGGRGGGAAGTRRAVPGWASSWGGPRRGRPRADRGDGRTPERRRLRGLDGAEAPRPACAWGAQEPAAASPLDRHRPDPLVRVRPTAGHRPWRRWERLAGPARGESGAADAHGSSPTCVRDCLPISPRGGGLTQR